jgi:hypothetical protein
MYHNDTLTKDTSSAIDNILGFLTKQIDTYETELKLYSDAMFAQFRETISNSIAISKKSIEYYKGLKDSYLK